MSREYARSPCGERAIGKIPGARGKNTTIIAVLGIEEIISWDRFEGAMNQFSFIDYIERNLSKVWNIEDFLVMDNGTLHKTPLVIKTLEKYKIKHIFLPPYYPDLNPIELFWSIFKSLLKTMEARTKNELFICIHEIFRRLKTINPIPLFKKCGYFLLDILKSKTNFNITEELNELTYKINLHETS